VSNPNSPLTLIRQCLARWLTVGPDAGEAWCLHCSLSDGRTRVLSQDGIAGHAQSHVKAGPEQAITIQSARKVLI
jgi:hypothetical protein